MDLHWLLQATSRSSSGHEATVGGEYESYTAASTILPANQKEPQSDTALIFQTDW